MRGRFPRVASTCLPLVQHDQGMTNYMEGVPAERLKSVTKLHLVRLFDVWVLDRGQRVLRKIPKPYLGP